MKRHVKNAFATAGNNILPGTMPDLLKLLQAFVEPTTTSNATPRRDPNHPGVTMVETSSGDDADASKVGDDMTGITNKAGRSGYDHCGTADHWKATCPHKGKTAGELKIIRA